MALSEIEKLERRYAENPRGLTFAPLAEVHRKQGDVSRALELLRPGLTIHPDYIPASIVLGRCHFDLGDLPAAETAFMHVLGLDGENVIGLKALADLTERQGRFDEAERWLHALLDIDRSNDEARDQLSRVEAARIQTESAAMVDLSEDGAASAPAAVPADVAGGEPPAMDVSLLEQPATPGALDVGAVEPVTDAEPEPMSSWETESAEPEDIPLDLEQPEAIADLDDVRPEGIELEQPVSLDETVKPLAGLVGRDDQAEAGSHDAGSDFRFETAEDIILTSRGGGEFQVSNTAEELLGERGPQHPEPMPAEPMSQESMSLDAVTSGPPPEVTAGTSDAWPSEEPNAEPAAPEPAAAPTGGFEPAATDQAPWAMPVAEPPSPPEPELVVTESMAELLERQGHPAEALAVYRHLESRSGGQPRFQEKIAELERATAGGAPPAVAAGAAPTATPAIGPSYSVEVTRGRSVQAFLRELLAARPPAMVGGPSVHGAPARSGPESEGAPTRPAHDGLSLSSVFGEESAPSPPAVSASGGAGSGKSGLSYDEFFGSAGTSSVSRAPRAPDPKTDDLDQFHAWLQNLKR
ncbi:MAG: tetratricopeptide repeat protein [Gemmatimonadales bacterium]